MPRKEIMRSIFYKGAFQLFKYSRKQTKKSKQYGFSSEDCIHLKLYDKASNYNTNRNNI